MCEREQSAQLCYPLRHAETRDLPGRQYLRADRAAQNARLEARRRDRAQHAHGGDYWTVVQSMSALPPESACDAEIGNQKKLPPIREAAFASLMAPLRPVPALVDPTDASGEREASGRRRILQYDNRKTTARPAQSS